jgi:hypothetical protein
LGTFNDAAPLTVIGIIMDTGGGMRGEFSVVCFKALPPLGGAEEMREHLNSRTS